MPKVFLCFLLATSLGLASPPVVAQTVQVEPAGVLPATARSPFGADPLAAFGTGWNLPATFGRASAEPVRDLPFPVVHRVETLQQPPNFWDVGSLAVSVEPVAKGDTLFVECWARTISSTSEIGQATIALMVQQHGDPWTKSFSIQLAVEKSWQRLAYAFRSLDGYPAGKMNVSICAGFRPQTVEVGGLRVANLGRGVEPDSLPITRVNYAGRAADAPWRAAAAGRIAKIRQGDLVVEVVDGQGKPIPGATVTIEQQRHAFPFGSAMDAAYINDRQDPNAEKYRRFAVENFTRVPIENHLKWQFWELPDSDGWAGRANALKAVQWLHDNGIEVQGTVTVYPHWDQVPKRLEQWKSEPAKLRSEINGHIAEILGRTRGLCESWIHVNEPFDSFAGKEQDFLTTVGRAEIVKWFAQAKGLSPGVRLVFNDYCHLNSTELRTPHTQYTENLIKETMAAGAPISSYGIQAHIGTSLPSPMQVVDELDRLHRELGLPLSITEFDIEHFDRGIQGDYTRDFLTACFSNPHVEEILCWGYYAPKHWKPVAAWMDAQWNLLPPGKAWLDLVKGAWWTRYHGASDATGIAKTRAFYGRHQVTATTPTGSRTMLVELDPGKVATVKLVVVPDVPAR